MGVAIKVRVYVPSFISHEQIAQDGTITLAEGATLHQLYDYLHIPLPLRLSFLYRVNYEPAKWNTRLEDGDVVTFLFPVSGG